MRSRENAINMWKQFPPQEFVYDVDANLFTVADRQVEPLQLLPVIMSTAETSKTPEELLETTPVVLAAFGNPSQLPVMFEWLRAANREKQFVETRKIMRKVYNELTQEDFTNSSEGDGFGFNVELLRPGHPTFSVVGNCACMGVDPMGFPFDSHAWDEGLASYSFHNVDTEAQKIALYSGIGHMARLVLKS